MKKPSAGTLHEQTFNIEFARALAATDARWRAHADECILAERSGVLDQGRADVLIDDPRMPAVAVELSFDPADADKDARARLGGRTARGGRPLATILAVHVPAECRGLSADAAAQGLQSGRQLVGYALHQAGLDNGPPRRWPPKGFIRGTVQDAGRLIAAAALPKELIDARAENVALLVRQAAHLLQSRLHERAQREVTAAVGQNSPLEGLRTTMVLWLNALLTQQRLQAQGAQGVPPLRTTSGEIPNPRQLYLVWQQIIDVNWRSIFEPAVQALGVCGDLHRAATGQALRRLVEAVEVIEDADLGQHINLGAELFPKLASDRKQSAAFYTQPATAELLASLVIRRADREEAEWADPGLLRRAILADFACGTGTLLRAGYLRVQALHEAAGGTEESVAELHRGAMESGLRGADISPIAAHLTSSSLANIGRGESYGDTQVGWVRVSGEPPQAGSLEYLAASVAEDLFGSRHGRAGGGESGRTSVEALHGSVDWILMNPPYSRTRGGQSAFDVAGLTEEARQRCQQRWQGLVRKQPAVLSAGMAASFLVVAKLKAKPESGRIGFVLPLTCAFADSWTRTRAMVETEFEEVVLIAAASGASVRRAGFSADTGMEEMLLVATRRSEAGRGSVLRCVTLHEPCCRSGEAGELSRAIEIAAACCVAAGSTHPITVGDSEVGCVTAMAASGDGAPWNMVGVTHGGLALAADALTRGMLGHGVSKPVPLGLEMGTIEAVFEVGPTHHLLGHRKGNEPIGAFEFHPVRGASDALGADRALWEADAKRQRRLRLLPTHKGCAPPGVGSAAQRERMRATAGTLFYARNFRWTSQSLLAATTARPTLGGRAWTALRHSDIRVCKAFALWWNSTLGLVVHWTQGQRTQHGRSTTQIGALKKIPCPRLDRLSGAALDMAAARFDVLSGKDLLPARDAHKDPVRIEIDEVVVGMLELHKREQGAEADLQRGVGQALGRESETGDTVGILRKLMCEEPSVHGILAT